MTISNDDFQNKDLKSFIEEVAHILDKGCIQRYFGARKRNEEHKSLQGDLGKVGDPILTDEDCGNKEEESTTYVLAVNMDHGATTDGFSSISETLIDWCHDGVLNDEFPSFAKESTGRCYDGEVPIDRCQGRHILMDVHSCVLVT